VQTYQDPQSKGNESDEMDGNLIFDNTGDLGKSYGASLFATILFIGIGADLLAIYAEERDLYQGLYSIELNRIVKQTGREDQERTRRTAGRLEL
jgi:hypothetical protein